MSAPIRIFPSASLWFPFISIAGHPTARRHILPPITPSQRRMIQFHDSAHLCHQTHPADSRNVFTDTPPPSLPRMLDTGMKEMFMGPKATSSSSSPVPYLLLMSSLSVPDCSRFSEPSNQTTGSLPFILSGTQPFSEKMSPSSVQRPSTLLSSLTPMRASMNSRRLN